MVAARRRGTLKDGQGRLDHRGVRIVVEDLVEVIAGVQGRLLQIRQNVGAPGVDDGGRTRGRLGRLIIPGRREAFGDIVVRVDGDTRMGRLRRQRDVVNIVLSPPDRSTVDLFVLDASS